MDYTFELDSGIYRLTSDGKLFSQSKIKIPIVGKGMQHTGEFKLIIKPEKEIKQQINSRGYLTVSINKKTYMVHRLIAKHFIGEPTKEQTQVNHKDGNKLNNNVSNLEWCTPQQNIQHAILTGLNNSGLGVKKEYKTAATKAACLANLKDKSALTDDDVRYCRQVHKPRDPHYSSTALANKFGISVVAMNKVVKGLTYRNVK